MEQIAGQHPNMEQLKKFISTVNYNKLIEEAKRLLKIEVDDNLPSFNILNIELRDLEKSKIGTNELAVLIEEENERARILNFVAAKLEKYSDNEDDQEYPEGEEPDEDDKPVTRKIHPFGKNFLVFYLVEYYFLKNNPKELEGYLKSIRMPQASRYAKELKEIYSKL